MTRLNRSSFDDLARVTPDAAGIAEPHADETLLRQYVESGCEDAFKRIVSRHAGWLYQICRRNLCDEHLAEDATQAVFLLLSRKAPSLSPQCHLGGWLFQTCRYVLADVRKHRIRYRRRLETARDLERYRISHAAQPQPSPDPALLGALDEAIACLRESDRQAILMHFYEGLSTLQMAEQLGLSKEGAKKRVTRALSRLRRRLTRKIQVGGAAVPLSVLVLLLRAGAAEGTPAGLTAVVAKAATVPGFASAAAELIASGVRHATVHGTAKLLAALAVSAAPMVAAVSILPPARSQPAGGQAIATGPAWRSDSVSTAATAAGSRSIPLVPPTAGAVLARAQGARLSLREESVFPRRTNCRPAMPAMPNTAHPSGRQELAGLLTAVQVPGPARRVVEPLRPREFSTAVIALVADSSKIPTPAAAEARNAAAGRRAAAGVAGRGLLGALPPALPLACDLSRPAGPEDLLQPLNPLSVELSDAPVGFGPDGDVAAGAAIDAASMPMGGFLAAPWRRGVTVHALNVRDRIAPDGFPADEDTLSRWRVAMADLPAEGRSWIDPAARIPRVAGNDPQPRFGALDVSPRGNAVPWAADGSIGLGHLAALQGRWGDYEMRRDSSRLPGTQLNVVPEPSTGVVAIVFAGVVLCRRRRDD